MLNRDSILKSIKILLFFFASSVSLSHKISHAGVVTGHAVQCWQADICGLYCTVLLQAQVLSLVVMCSVGKLAPVGVLSEKRVQREIQTFLGAETLHRFIIPNPWIGPPVTTLLGRNCFIMTEQLFTLGKGICSPLL